MTTDPIQAAQGDSVQEPLVLPFQPTAQAPEGDSRAAVYGLRKQTTCAFPGCGVQFTPKDPAGESRFHNTACKNNYWRMAAQIGDRILRSRAAGPQSQQVLAVLRTSKWVNLNRRLPDIIIRDAVQKLRRKGFIVRCRRAWDGIYSETVYEYRLVSEPSKS